MTGRLTAYDVRCIACSNSGEVGAAVHVAWLPGDHDAGDEIGFAHIQKTGACGSYCRHEIVSKLSGINPYQTA